MHIYSNMDNSPNKSNFISAQGPVTPGGGYYLVNKTLLFELIVKYHETRDAPIGKIAYNQLLKWASLSGENPMYHDISTTAKLILAKDPNISVNIQNLKFSSDIEVSRVARNHGARVLHDIRQIRDNLSRDARNGYHHDQGGWTFNPSHITPVNTQLVEQIPENGVLASPVREIIGTKPAPYAFARSEGIPDPFTLNHRVPADENNASHYCKYRYNPTRGGERFWYQVWGAEIADRPFDPNNVETATFAYNLSYAMENMIKCKLFTTRGHSRT